MKYLLSISWHTFASLSIDEILEILNSEDLTNVDGIELASPNFDEMLAVLKFCQKSNLIFQCHTPNYKDKNLVYNYLRNVSELSDIYGKKINVVLHPLENNNFKKSIVDTIEYVESIFLYIKINKLNVEISLENLNFHHNRRRINVDVIDEILKQFDNLKFTYDIGHDIFDNDINSTLTDVEKVKINNVHLHTVHNGKDHENFIKYPDNLIFLKNAILSLEEMNYNENVVVEIGVDMFLGNNTREKLIDYIESITIIKDIFSTKYVRKRR